MALKIINFVPVIVLTVCLSSGAAVSGDTYPPYPDRKPAVPGDLAGISRALSPEEARLRDIVDQYRFQKLASNPNPAESFSDPLTKSLVTWLSLNAASSSHSFTEIHGFLETHKDWPNQSRLRRKAEVALSQELGRPTSDQSGSTPEKEARLRELFSQRQPLTPEGTTLWVNLLLDQGEDEMAKRLIREGWVELNFSPSQERTYRQDFAHLLTQADELARFDDLVWRRKSAAALRQGKRLGSGYAELARARLNLAARRPGVDAAIKQVPASLQDDLGLVYDRLLWRTRKGRYDSVLELLEPLDHAVPYQERWWPIRTWAARKALRDEDPQLAYRLVRAHGLSSGVGFAESEWLAGWISLRRLNKAQQAYDHFIGLYHGVTSPISRSRGAYWAGRAAAALGKADLALTWYGVAADYDTTFYGQIATQELPIDGISNKGIARSGQSRVSVSSFEQSLFDSSQMARVIRLLNRIKARDLKALFLRHLRDQANDGKDLLLAAQLATEMERPDIALSTAKVAQRRGYHLDRQLYPVRELPSDHVGPEDALVLAVIRQESAFDPTAISHAGARGLMQIMPTTAKLTAAQAGQVYNKAWLTDDPNYNLRLGRFYLQSLIEEFDGSYILALASYNAGPGRALRWIKDFGDPRDPDVDAIDWIEQIPFNETRNYVQRVLENLAVYRGLIPVPFNGWAKRVSEPAS